MSEQKVTSAPQVKREGSVTTVRRALKADTAALITNGTVSLPEDEYAGSYMSAGGSGFTAILEPTFKPRALYYVVEHNNVLAQCIEALEVNIDGTGHSIDLEEGATTSEEEKKGLEDFFDQPYPGKTMVSIRRSIRRDLEATGNGYLEVIRNMGKEIVMINNLDACDVRLIRLDEPVLAEKVIVRSGKDLKVNLRVRERRFVQLINGKKVYFREFGSSRQLDRDTGAWSDGKLPMDKQASEIIHFLMYREAGSPYGRPRWINQLPSALGSRKAEEFNLEFFDAGGIPPLLILVQGGYLGDTVKEDLVGQLNGSGPKHRAAIVEAISSSGSLDSSGTVQVRVERFGSERQSDAMFQTYDKSCEDHVRIGFRLPPMFIGKAQDYNFATAKTGYMVAEAQVFYPERFEFDSIINNTIVKDLGAVNYKFKSLPMTLTDVEMQLQGLDKIMTANGTDAEEIVSVVNKITGVDVEYKKQEEPPKPTDAAHIDPLTNLPYTNPVDPLQAHQVTGKPVKPIPATPKENAKGAKGNVVPIKKDEFSVIKLANQWASMLGIDGPCTISMSERELIKKEVSGLEGPVLRAFNEALASKALTMVSEDQEGLGELCGCATQLVR